MAQAERKVNEIEKEAKVSFGEFINEVRKWGCYDIKTNMVQSNPSYWMVETDFRGIDFRVKHDSGYMILLTSSDLKNEISLASFEEINKRIVNMLEYSACGRCKLKDPEEDGFYQTYIYSDGMSDDKCLKMFEKCGFGQYKTVFNLEKLNQDKAEEGFVGELVLR